MNVIDFTAQGPRPRIAIFFCAWIAYGFYYYGINKLNATSISVPEVIVSLPVFALIAHGVYLIIDRLIAKRFMLIGALCLIAFYVAVSLLSNWLVNTVNGWLDAPINDGKAIKLMDGGFLANIITIISNYSLFGVAAYFVNSSVKHARAKQTEAEARLVEAERRLQAERETKRFEFFMLAGQVSPHFIANLLNSWRVRLKNTHQEVVANLELAYELMVYYMEARLPAKRRVPLALEVERLHSYVKLTTDFGSPKYIQCNCQGELSGYTVPPTSLLDFIENGTKHGRTDLPESPVRMDITVQNNQLSCTCSNVVKDNPDRESHGVGLANLRRRLELEYNDRFSLESSRNGREYTARLTITY